MNEVSNKRNCFAERERERVVSGHSKSKCLIFTTSVFMVVIIIVSFLSFSNFAKAQERNHIKQQLELIDAGTPPLPNPVQEVRLPEPTPPSVGLFKKFTNILVASLVGGVTSQTANIFSFVTDFFSDLFTGKSSVPETIIPIKQSDSSSSRNEVAIETNEETSSSSSVIPLEKGIQAISGKFTNTQSSSSSSATYNLPPKTYNLPPDISREEVEKLIKESNTNQQALMNALIDASEEKSLSVSQSISSLEKKINSLDQRESRQLDHVYNSVSRSFDDITSLDGVTMTNSSFSGTTGTFTGNLSGTTGSFSGLLTLNANLLLSASAYLNFGGTEGTTGYGFRDNGGTIQVKNSAGSWSNIPTSGATQWTTTGDDIYYTTGNVGIGTTTPNWKLSVSGIGSFDNYARASYFTATSTISSTFPYASTTAITATTASTTNLIVSNNSTLGTVIGGTWQGTAIGDAYFTKSGDWTGTLDTYEASSLLARANHTGTQGVATLSNYDWTFLNNYGAINLTGSSTKSIWAQGGINASSTSNFVYASTTALTVSGNSYLGTVSSGVWNGAAIGNSYLDDDITLTNLTQITNRAITDTTGTLTIARGGTGQTSFGQGWLHSDGTTLTSSTSPTVNYITATSTTATSTFPYLSVTTNSNLGTVIGGTWQGTAIGDAYLTKSGDWTGTLDTYNGSDLLARANHTGTQGVATLSNYDWTFSTNYGTNNLTGSTTKPIWAQGGINASSTSNFVYASTTALTISGSAYLGSLNGPLQANNGLVSATTSVGSIYGGTGIDSSALTGIAQIVSGTWSASSTLSTAFGGTGWNSIQSNSILLGNGAGRFATTSAGTDGYVLALSNGVPTWLATSTLSTITGTLTVAKGGTGQTSFGQGWLHSNGTTFTSSTSPTVAWLTATSTTATSTFAWGLQANALNITSTSATSTFANGIDLSKGCFSINGTCVGGASSQWTTSGSNIYYTAGNIGIGTTSPGRELHIASSRPDILLEETDASTNEKIWRITADGGVFSIGTTDDTNLGDSVEVIKFLRNGSDPQVSDIVFQTAANVERMRINNDGNVGIGTTSPSVLLHLNNTGSNPSQIYLESTATGYNNIMFREAGALTSFIQHVNSNYTNASERNLLEIDNRATGGAIAFYTGGAERFRLANDGNVGIGTVSPDSIKLDVEDDIEVGTGTTGCVRDADNTSIAGTCVSDINLKKNITSLSSAIGGLSLLRPVTFEWRNDEYDWLNGQAGVNYGLVAQEVEQVFPEMVQTDSRGYKRVSYDIGLSMRMLQGIKEISSVFDGTSATTTGAASIRSLFAGTTTPLVIDADGNVGIGTTTPNYKLQVAGDIAATAFINTSTKTAKKDIAYLSSSQEEGFLNKIKNTSIANYHYNIENENNPLRLGLIAEEAPSEILSVDGKGVDVYKMATFTLGGVKALQKEMEKMKIDLTALSAGAAASGGQISDSLFSWITDKFKVVLGITFGQDKVGAKNLCAKKSNGDEVCVDGDKLQELLDKNSISQTSSSSSSSVATGSSSSTSSDSSASAVSSASSSEAVSSSSSESTSSSVETVSSNSSSESSSSSVTESSSSASSENSSSSEAVSSPSSSEEAVSSSSAGEAGSSSSVSSSS